MFSCPLLLSLVFCPGSLGTLFAAMASVGGLHRPPVSSAFFFVRVVGVQVVGGLPLIIPVLQNLVEPGALPLCKRWWRFCWQGWGRAISPTSMFLFVGALRFVFIFDDRCGVAPGFSLTIACWFIWFVSIIENVHNGVEAPVPLNHVFCNCVCLSGRIC